jgi:hypothetical protein
MSAPQNKLGEGVCCAALLLVLLWAYSLLVRGCA